MTADDLTFAEIAEAGYREQKEADEEMREFFDRTEYPENLCEDELRNFIYLRSCVFLGVKPVGAYEGNAGICAEVLRNGGGILDMYDAGMDILYAACLSSHRLEADLQREIIDGHIPF